MSTALPLPRRLLTSNGSALGVAVGAGALVGLTVGEGSLVLLAVFAVALAAGAVAVLRDATLGPPLLAVFVVMRVSDVAVERHGLPSLMQPLLALLLLALCWQVLWHRRPPSGLLTPALLLGAYGVVLATGLFAPVDAELASFYFGAFVRDAVIALVVVALTRSLRTLERVVWAMVGAGLVLSALGVYQYTTGSFANEFGGFARAEVLNIVGTVDSYRISGPIADPNHYAQLLVTVLPLAAGRLLWARSLLGRVVAAAAVVCLVLAVVFTFSRGAFVAVAALGLLFMLRLRPPLWAWVASGGLAAALLVALPDSFVDRLLGLAGLATGAGGGEASLSGRLSAQYAGLHMFLDHPVLGVGIGQFAHYYRDYAGGHGVNTSSRGLEPHNLYLEVAAETGVVGLLAFGTILVVAFVRLESTRRTLALVGLAPGAHLVGDLRLALVGYLLCGLFVHNAYPRVFWLLIGLSLAVSGMVELRQRRAHDRVLEPA